MTASKSNAAGFSSSLHTMFSICTLIVACGAARGQLGSKPPANMLAMRSKRHMPACACGGVTKESAQLLLQLRSTATHALLLQVVLLMQLAPRFHHCQSERQARQAGHTAAHTLPVRHMTLRYVCLMIMMVVWRSSAA